MYGVETAFYITLADDLPNWYGFNSQACSGTYAGEEAL
jgi:hypothetical protein